MSLSFGPARDLVGDPPSCERTTSIETGFRGGPLRLIATLFASLFLLSACGSCQDPGGQIDPVENGEEENGEEEEYTGLCTEDPDCRFGEVCLSGICQPYFEPAGKGTPCVSDAQCAPTERCSTWSGNCVTVAGTEPPPDREGAVCIDEDRRTCGESKIGMCRLGYQECVEGQWSETCVGVRNPSAEICDGRDNDCDGIIDNPEFADEWCHDGDPCRLPSRCEESRCVLGRMKDCGGLDATCQAGVCDAETGECVAEFFEDGTTCDDGNLCTTSNTCAEGVCGTGAPVDCGALDSECLEGICNPINGRCIAVPRTDGTLCNDGNQCTYATTCADGVCGGGAPLDCSALDDQCNAGVCDPGTGTCTTHPIRNGMACDDGFYCSIATVCSSGTCGGGLPRNCSLVGNQCNAGVCDEDARACVQQPLADDTSCENGLYCTVNDRCQAGVCQSGDGRDCGAAGGSCRDGVCDEDTRSCTGEPVADGTPCDDGLFCTVANQCLGGTCTGESKNCSEVGDACNDGICNETDRRCEPIPANEGAACDDGLFCTIDTLCSTGECLGSARDCSDAGDQCNLGVCSEAQGECIQQPVADNTLCSDGQWCTVNDRCMNGTCTGTMRNCSIADDDCNEGVCDEATDSCVPSPLADGTACDDGLFCSVDEACVAGTCVGASRDCSLAGDECNDGVCDEGAKACVATPKPEATPCADGLFCTVDEKCYDGQCIGMERDCGFITGGDPCYDPFCDEVNGQCVAVDNGTCFNQPPVATCGVSDSNPYPLDIITLIGSGSDPDGDPLIYSWSVVNRPSGSTSQPADPSAATTTFYVDLAGAFTFELTVSDGELTDTCQVSIVVVPPQDLHVQLVWEEDTGDLDLHMTKHGEPTLGSFFDSSAAEASCWWPNCAEPGVAWGATLDVDSTAGFGPENINIDQNPVLDIYHVGVHKFCDQSSYDFENYWGPLGRTLRARVRVFCNGQLVSEIPSATGWKSLEEMGDFWLVAAVEWTGIGAAGCSVTVLDDTSRPGATYAVAAGIRALNHPDIHCKGGNECSSHADCREFERCMCLNASCKEAECRLSHPCTQNSDCDGLGYAGGCDTNIRFCVR